TEELAALSGPLPRATAVGHPRLEALHRARNTSKRAGPAHGQVPAPRYAVLYLGTNGVEADDTAALQLVVTAFDRVDDVEMRYLPHPNEPMRKYEQLI